MSERYTKLFALPENLYAAGAPVIISAGALLKDNQRGNILAQLKLRSITDKVIKAVTVSIKPLDTAGVSLGDSVRYQYLDLQVQRDTDFGQKTAIPLSNPAIRYFSAIVTEVVFTDLSVWHGENQPWEVLAKPTSIDFLGDNELTKQFRIEYGEGCENLPLEQKDLWHCICGAINRQREVSCHVCHKSRIELRTIDMDDLRKKKGDRLDKERKAAEEKAEQQKQIAENRRKAFKRTTVMGTVVVVALVLLICFFTKIILPSGHYIRAERYLQGGETAKAAIEFGKAGGWLNARQRSFALWDEITQRDVISIGDYHTVALKNNGTVIATVFDKRYETGDTYRGQGHVSDWSDIVAVSAGGKFTIGLKSDGTVVMCGDNTNGIDDVDKWSDIVAISAGRSHAVALRADGTVLAVGYNKYGQCDVSQWQDIIAVAAGSYHTVGLKIDGTVVAVGNQEAGELQVGTWSDIKYIAAGATGTAAIRKDGIVVSTEKYSDTAENMTNIVEISCKNNGCVGLKADGTTINCYPDGEGLVALAIPHDGLGGDYIGVRADGTVFSPGAGQKNSNYAGRLNVQEWTNIKNPGRIQ